LVWVAGSARPASHLSFAADQLELADALGRLSLRYRQVLALPYLADLPVEQIAGELVVGVGALGGGGGVKGSDDHPVSSCW
jgi:DNA-directed RNA polymerase specialized sigma24 family protein